jgi:hypothetical protein
MEKGEFLPILVQMVLAIILSSYESSMAKYHRR